MVYLIEFVGFRKLNPSHALRIYDGITSALYAPNTNGIIGDVARVASPELAYKIGQYFKGNDVDNALDGGNRDGEGSAKHPTSNTKNAKQVAQTQKQINTARVENNIGRDGDLENVLNGNPNAPADISISAKKSTDIAMVTYNPHYDTKHGAYTNLQAQYDRAMTGISPELGIMKGHPVNASRFFNSTDMEYAMRQAEKMYTENPSKYTDSKGKISIDITFDRPIGEGFMGANKTNTRLGIAGEYRWSKSATVSIDPKTGKAYTAFPNMEQGYKKDNEMLKFIK